MRFTDETILTSMPPLRAKWALQGTQPVVAILGDHTRRVLSGTMSVRGGLLSHDAPQFHQEEWQTHLCMMRSLWRGWKLVLCLDRAPSHTAEESIAFAEDLGIALRWLPVAGPKLHPMDHLWRHSKGDVLAKVPYHSLDEGVTQIQQYLQDIGPAGWMRKAGLFSEKFWLREYCALL
jgi:transposase